MRFLPRLFAVMLIPLAAGALARAEMREPLCGILRAAHSGSFSPEELCQGYGASFCSGVSLGEAICKAGKASFCDNVTEAQAICKVGGGSFCDDNLSIPGAVCRVSNGSFCDSLDPQAKVKYFQIYNSCTH